MVTHTRRNCDDKLSRCCRTQEQETANIVQRSLTAAWPTLILAALAGRHG